MGLSDKNLYAYCDNNPVMRRDDGGMFWDTVFDVISLACSVVDVIKNPDDPWAWAGLAADVVSLAVPFATGGGTIVKAASKVDDVVDVARSVDKAADVFDTATDIGKATGKAKKAKKASTAAKNLCKKECFVAGTLVATEVGSVPIEEIQAGDMVWASDPETGEVALKEVVQTFRNETTELVHVTVNGEEIICTNEHPFYSPVKGWTEACQLRAGDILVLVNGEYVIVEQVQHEILEAPVATYNFEVQDFHTYYVGGSAILVHNKCKNFIAGLPNDMSSMDSTEILDTAINFLGEGYSEIAPGVFRSSDNLRQFRMTDRDLLGHGGLRGHVNFETLVRKGNGYVPKRNIHIFYID